MEEEGTPGSHHCKENPSFVEEDDVFVDEKNVNGKSDMVANHDEVAHPKMTTKKMLVVICILLTEMCERLTYYSVVANIVLYGTSVLKFSSTQSANVANIFTGRFKDAVLSPSLSLLPFFFLSFFCSSSHHYQLILCTSTLFNAVFNCRVTGFLISSNRFIYINMYAYNYSANALIFILLISSYTSKLFS